MLDNTMRPDISVNIPYFIEHLSSHAINHIVMFIRLERNNDK